eukprot:1159554-Pelagomonas_calceolata.AAC.2
MAAVIPNPRRICLHERFYELLVKAGSSLQIHQDLVSGKKDKSQALRVWLACCKLCKVSLIITQSIPQNQSSKEGASPAFASKDEQDKLPCVLELYEQAQAMKEPPACQCDGPALSGAEETDAASRFQLCTAQNNFARILAAQPQGMCNSSGSSSSRRGSAELPPLGALSINPSGAKSWKQEEQGLDSCDVSDQGSGTHPEVAQLQASGYLAVCKAVYQASCCPIPC